MPRTKTVSVRLTVEEIATLNKICQESGQTRPDVLRQNLGLADQTLGKLQGQLAAVRRSADQRVERILKEAEVRHLNAVKELADGHEAERRRLEQRIQSLTSESDQAKEALSAEQARANDEGARHEQVTREKDETIATLRYWLGRFCTTVFAKIASLPHQLEEAEDRGRRQADARFHELFTPGEIRQRKVEIEERRQQEAAAKGSAPTPEEILLLEKKRHRAAMTRAQEEADKEAERRLEEQWKAHLLHEAEELRAQTARISRPQEP